MDETGKNVVCNSRIGCNSISQHACTMYVCKYQVINFSVTQIDGKYKSHQSSIWMKQVRMLSVTAVLAVTLYHSTQVGKYQVINFSVTQMDGKYKSHQSSIWMKQVRMLSVTAVLAVTPPPEQKLTIYLHYYHKKCILPQSNSLIQE